MTRFILAASTALLATSVARAELDAETLEKAKAAYTTTCMACHQATGQGIPGAFPPITETPWAQGNPDRLIAQVLKGLMGEIEVKGVKYNSVMVVPPQDDATIALAVSYVRAAPEFKNKASVVTADQVKAVREKLKDKAGMWTVADLLKAYPLEEAKPAAPATPAAPAAPVAPKK